MVQPSSGLGAVGEQVKKAVSGEAAEDLGYEILWKKLGLKAGECTALNWGFFSPLMAWVVQCSELCDMRSLPFPQFAAPLS